MHKTIMLRSALRYGLRISLCALPTAKTLLSISFSCWQSSLTQI